MKIEIRRNSSGAFCAEVADHAENVFFNLTRSTREEVLKASKQMLQELGKKNELEVVELEALVHEADEETKKGQV